MLGGQVVNIYASCANNIFKCTEMQVLFFSGQNLVTFDIFMPFSHKMSLSYQL